MILVIDNYDSFTYNLVQYIGAITGSFKLKVFRNDQITVDEIEKLAPDKIVLSPGPGKPDDAGICLEVVMRLGETVPLLGVCLGHQVIGQAFGGEIIAAKKLMHGKVSLIKHDHSRIFTAIKSPFTAARYHSLVVNPERLPAVLQVTATADDGTIMGLKHKQFPIWAVQFHPESILTETGKTIIHNFLSEEEIDDDYNRSNYCCCREE